MSGEELFDVVDEHDRVIGTRPRSEVHRLNLFHRAAHVLVFNAAGKLFLQKRSLTKDCSPGLWDSSCAGHLESGEDYDSCARRELAEELGIAGEPALEKLFKIDAAPETSYEFAWVYRTVHEGPFRLDAQEIDEGRWFTPARLDAWIASAPRDLTPVFRRLWARLREA